MTLGSIHHTGVERRRFDVRKTWTLPNPQFNLGCQASMVFDLLTWAARLTWLKFLRVKKQNCEELMSYVENILLWHNLKLRMVLHWFSADQDSCERYAQPFKLSKCIRNKCQLHQCEDVSNRHYQVQQQRLELVSYSLNSLDMSSLCIYLCISQNIQTPWSALMHQSLPARCLQAHGQLPSARDALQNPRHRRISV